MSGPAGNRRLVSGADFDTSVPCVVLKIGRYPLSQGGVGAVRSLGRVGVEVHEVVEHPWTPAARSRYAAGIIVWPTTGREPLESLVAGVVEIGRRLDRRSVLLCTDDESAVLLAEHAEELGEFFLLPAVPADLPRRLAAKRELTPLCESLGIPSPKVAAPRDLAELEAELEGLSFPVMVKHAAVWSRLATRASTNSVVATRHELLALARDWPTPFELVLQEFIPPEVSEDWFCHAYVGADAASSVLLAGAKLRQYPSTGGLSTYSEAVENTDLLARNAEVFERLGYRGVADLDWRFDRREGTYKLLDFNPRLGGQFRLMETDAGIDVVRAAHLDLTGRAIPPGRQLVGETMLVEHLYLPSRLSQTGRAAIPPSVVYPRRVGGRRFAWWVADDPVPFVVLVWWVALQLVAKLGGRRRAVPEAQTSAAPRPRFVRRRR